MFVVTWAKDLTSLIFIRAKVRRIGAKTSSIFPRFFSPPKTGVLSRNKSLAFHDFDVFGDGDRMAV